MCQNSDYKIISFLEPGAPHRSGNAAAGYGSCWSASELHLTGKVRERVRKNNWRVKQWGNKKVGCGENTVWHYRRIQSCVLVMLWISLSSLLVFSQAFLADQRKEKMQKTVWVVTNQHFKQSFIKKKKRFMRLPGIGVDRSIRQDRSIKMMDLCYHDLCVCDVFGSESRKSTRCTT